MNELELPPTLRDAFYQDVWKIVRQIPSGRVSTYGQIASFIPAPTDVPPEDYKTHRARWTGTAMSACPPDVPWHRVINSQGKISIRRGAEQQRQLLEAEGIQFDDRDRINLKSYGWTGPSHEWLHENNLLAPDKPQQLSLL